MMSFSVVLVIALIIVQSASVFSQKHFPAEFPRCNRDDPKIGECMVKATNLVKPFLQKGLPQFNIPPLSPYTIPEVNLEQDTNSLNFKNVIHNLVIVGLDNYDFSLFDFDVKNLKFKGALQMGRIDLTGDYVFQGKILSIPLEGKGKFSTNVTSSNGTLEQSAKLVTRKGITYLQPLEPTIKINVGEVITDMGGLFDDNEQLKKAAETVIKENMQELVKEFTPAVEKVVEKIMQDLLTKTVAKVPYDELFPLSKSTS